MQSMAECPEIPDYELIAHANKSTCVYVNKTANFAHCAYINDHSVNAGTLIFKGTSRGGKKWRCPTKSMRAQVKKNIWVITIPKKWRNLGFEQRAVWMDELRKDFIVSDQTIITIPER